MVEINHKKSTRNSSVNLENELLGGSSDVHPLKRLSSKDGVTRRRFPWASVTRRVGNPAAREFPRRYVSAVGVSRSSGASSGSERGPNSWP